MQEKNIALQIEGMGIIIYSDFAVKGIQKNENYLKKHYWDAEDVAEKVNAGKIVGFCTEASGTYILKIREGIPCKELRDNTKFKLRLSIKVKGGFIYVRDLYDLMSWDDIYDNNQIIKIDDGYYTVLLSGNMPDSGYFGDNQVIYVHFIKDDEFVATEFKGVPDFVQAGKRVKLPLISTGKR